MSDVLQTQVRSEALQCYVEPVEHTVGIGPPILRAHHWPTNGHMIADVHRLGYLEDNYVLDPTYGNGTWWTQWRPAALRPMTPNGDVRGVVCREWDFTRMWFPADTFDAVTFDPPYKLNGTPSDPDHRYGVGEPTRWQDRHALIKAGLSECARVVKPKGTVLLKCQDQVCSGKIRWQTLEFSNYAVGLGLELYDRFDFMAHRPQPEGRRQIHAQANYSTLLVFRKTGFGAATARLRSQ